MFRKLSREQSVAVDIFLIWIIAGMAFNILGPSLKAGFVEGSKWLAWIPIGIAMLLSVILVGRSRVGVHMMFMVVNGLVGGVFGTKGVIDFSVGLLRFSWKFLILGLTGILLGAVCVYLTREFLKLIPDFLTHRRQMADLDSRIASWENPEPTSTVEQKPLAPEAELAVLVSIEYRLLNPPKTEELIFPNEFPLTKLLIQAFAISFAIRISLGNEPLLARVGSAAAFLVLVPFCEFMYRRTRSKVEACKPPPTTEFDEIRDNLIREIRKRRAELRRPDTQSAITTEQ